MKKSPNGLTTQIKAVQRVELPELAGRLRRVPPRPPDVVILGVQDIAHRLGIEERTVRAYQLAGLLGQRMGADFSGLYCATEDQVVWFQKYIKRGVGRPPQVEVDE